MANATSSAATQPFSKAKAFLAKQYKEEAFEGSDKLHIRSTGSVALDWVLGGGLAAGRLYEFFGTEGSGKTTAALAAAKSVQQQGRPVLYIDFEHAIDTIYARDSCGVAMDPDRFLLVQPTTAEAGLDMALEIIEKFGAGLVIVDSVAAMVPKAEVEGGVGDLQVGAQARVMGKAMRKLTGVTHRHDSAVIFINQVRDKIGSVGFGDPTTTPGGRALKFFASVRIQMSKIKTLDDGVRIRARIKKSKITGNQKRVAEFAIRGGIGVDAADEILTLGVKYGVIGKPNAQAHKFPKVAKPIPRGEKPARIFLRKPKNQWYVEWLRGNIMEKMLEEERLNTEFLPTKDGDPSFDIDADGGKWDGTTDLDWIVPAKKKSTEAVETEEISEDS